MLTIKTFTCNMLQENCYVVNDESGECMIVDCGAFFPEESEAIFQYIEENGLKPVHSVLTHGHLDHIFGVKAIYDKYGLRPIIHSRDEKTYKDVNESAKQFGIDINLDMPPILRFVKDGDTITIGNTSFKVIETPGHSGGSVFYYCAEENVTFSGDTLFRGSIGRTDLPGGSMFQIIQSLRMITQLPDDTRVFSGHGAETTIGYELATNMYLDR